MQRTLLVFDGEAWFIRRVRESVHDGERDEMVYRCDLSLGGPYLVVEHAVKAYKAIVRKMP